MRKQMPCYALWADDNDKNLQVMATQYKNPTEAMLEAAGYHKAVPHQPTEAEVAEMERVARVSELHELLQSTDYKVIKNSECQMLGLPLPYDPAEVHAEKQAWRDELNELENK